jgi:hypothetical protein
MVLDLMNRENEVFVSSCSTRQSQSSPFPYAVAHCHCQCAWSVFGCFLELQPSAILIIVIISRWYNDCYWIYILLQDHSSSGNRVGSKWSSTSLCWLDGVSFSFANFFTMWQLDKGMISAQVKPWLVEGFDVIPCHGRSP